MTKPQHKRIAVASMFQNGISRNTKCAVRDGFRRDSHIYSVQLSYKAIDRLIHFIVCAGCTASVARYFI